MNDRFEILKKFIIEKREYFEIAADIHENWDKIQKNIIIDFFNLLERRLKEKFSEEWATYNKIKDWKPWMSVGIYKKQWELDIDSEYPFYKIGFGSNVAKGFRNCIFYISRPNPDFITEIDNQIFEKLNKNSGGAFTQWLIWYRWYEPLQGNKNDLIKMKFEQDDTIEKMLNKFVNIKDDVESLIDTAAEEAHNVICKGK